MKSVAEIIFYLYLAPIRLSDEIEKKVNQSDTIDFLIKLLLVQLPCIAFITWIILQFFDQEMRLKFLYGEIIGILIILVFPIIILPVKLSAKRSIKRVSSCILVNWLFLDSIFTIGSFKAFFKYFCTLSFILKIKTS